MNLVAKRGSVIVCGGCRNIENDRHAKNFRCVPLKCPGNSPITFLRGRRSDSRADSLHISSGQDERARLVILCLRDQLKTDGGSIRVIKTNDQVVSLAGHRILWQPLDMKYPGVASGLTVKMATRTVIRSRVICRTPGRTVGKSACVIQTECGSEDRPDAEQDPH